jgi:integrase
MKTTGLGYLFQSPKETGYYYLQYSINGKRKVISLKTRNETEAKTRQKDMMKTAMVADTKEKVLFHIGENRKLISSVKYLLEDVWDKFKQSQIRPDSRSGTLENYERNWNKFKKWLISERPKIKRINQITSLEAETYMAKIWAGGMAPATFNYHLHSLKHIFKILCGSTENPFVKIHQKQLEHDASRKPFTLEQVNSILAAFDDPELLKLKIENQSEMKTMFYLGAYIGARLIDCALMKRESIDLAQRSISYVPIKTQRINRRVTIPIRSEQFYNHLSLCLKAESTSEYLLPAVSQRYIKNKGGVVNDSIKVFAFCKIRKVKSRLPKAERKQIKNTGKQRLNEKVEYGFHSFRHFVGTTLANLGTPIKTLAEMLGDDIATASKYYIHVSGEEKKKAIGGLLLDGDKEQEKVIDVTLIDDSSDMKERVKQALELIAKADSQQIEDSFKEELLKLLK